MEELIRTRVLDKEGKKNFDENYDRIFSRRKPIGRKVTKRNESGIIIRYNYPMGREKCKVIRPTFSNKDGFEPKQLDGHF